MTLLERPELNEPIPNADIPNNPREYSVKGPYWDMLIGENLEVGAVGELTYPDGIGEGNGNNTLQGTWWPMGIGAGLGIDGSGNLQISVPAQCDYPPYSCRTDVNPFCVTDFTNAWNNCTSLTSFPLLDVSNGTNFGVAWYGCNSLTSFPAGMFNSCLATNFAYAWQNCALDQTSVDNILVSLDVAGQSNGVVNLDGGTSAAPSATGLAAAVNLTIAKGWTVLIN